MSGGKLYDPFWEAVDHLELCGFKVLGLMCDGLSANCQLFSLHGNELVMLLRNTETQYWSYQVTYIYDPWMLIIHARWSYYKHTLAKNYKLPPKVYMHLNINYGFCT